MRPRLISTIAALALVVAMPALADPPKPGTKNHIFEDPFMANGQLVLCDEHRQVEEIARASNPFDIFHKYNNTINEYNEVTCDARVWHVDEVGESYHLGVLPFGSFLCQAWSVQVHTSKGFERWILYLEPKVDGQGNLIRFEDT